MVNTILNLRTIIILLISLALDNYHFVVSSTDINQDHDISEEEKYALDMFLVIVAYFFSIFGFLRLLHIWFSYIC